MNLIQTLPEPTASNTRITWTERHDDPWAQPVFEVKADYLHRGRRFTAKVERCIDTLFHRLEESRAIQRAMAEQARALLPNVLAEWLAVVNPIDNTVPAGFKEVCEAPPKEEPPLDWTSSVMTMDEWERRFGAKFGDASNAISENVSAKPAPAKIGKVSILPVITRLDIPAERVLNGALDADLTGCFVVGVNPGGELYFASSFADGGTVLWWMEKAKKALLEQT